MPSIWASAWSGVSPPAIRVCCVAPASLSAPARLAWLRWVASSQPVAAYNYLQSRPGRIFTQYTWGDYSVARHRATCMGVYGSVEAPGVIRVGDPVQAA